MRRAVLAVIALTLVALVGFAAPNPVHAQAQVTVSVSCADFAAQNNVIVLNIRFPGLKTTVCAKADGAMKEYAYVDTIGNYIVTFYLWFAGAAGTLAVFMVMYGGFQWITAAGNAGRIGQAKETVTGAIIGLVLLLGSYVLLSSISTGFVNFTALPINTIPRTGLTCYDGSASAQCTDTAGACDPLANARCGVAGGSCGCTVQCLQGEHAVDFTLCKKIKNANVAAIANTGEAVLLSRPISFQQLLDALKRTTGKAWDGGYRTLFAFLNDVAATQQGSGEYCSWLQLAGAQACPPAADIRNQLQYYYGITDDASLKTFDKSDLIVGGNEYVCCQDVIGRCVVRSGTETVPASGYGTCEP